MPIRPSKTALVRAVRELDLPTTRAILRAKPELVAVVDDRGANLLHLACAIDPARAAVSKAAQTRYVRFLLEQGLPVDARFGKDQVTPLFLAVARARSVALVKTLLAAGAK